MALIYDEITRITVDPRICPCVPRIDPPNFTFHGATAVFSLCPAEPPPPPPLEMGTKYVIWYQPQSINAVSNLRLSPVPPVSPFGGVSDPC